MKRREAGSGRDLADIEMPVVRLLEIEEGFEVIHSKHGIEFYCASYEIPVEP